MDELIYEETVHAPEETQVVESQKEQTVSQETSTVSSVVDIVKNKLSDIVNRLAALRKSKPNTYTTDPEYLGLMGEYDNLVRKRHMKLGDGRTHIVHTAGFYGMIRENPNILFDKFKRGIVTTVEITYPVLVFAGLTALLPTTLFALPTTYITGTIVSMVPYLRKDKVTGYDIAVALSSAMIMPLLPFINPGTKIAFFSNVVVMLGGKLAAHGVCNFTMTMLSKINLDGFMHSGVNQPLGFLHLANWLPKPAITEAELQFNEYMCTEHPWITNTLRVTQFVAETALRLYVAMWQKEIQIGHYYFPSGYSFKDHIELAMKTVVSQIWEKIMTIKWTGQATDDYWPVIKYTDFCVERGYMIVDTREDITRLQKMYTDRANAILKEIETYKPDQYYTKQLQKDLEHIKLLQSRVNRYTVENMNKDARQNIRFPWFVRFFHQTSKYISGHVFWKLLFESLGTQLSQEMAHAAVNTEKLGAFQTKIGKLMDEAAYLQNQAVLIYHHKITGQALVYDPEKNPPMAGVKAGDLVMASDLQNPHDADCQQFITRLENAGQEISPEYRSQLCNVRDITLLRAISQGYESQDTLDTARSMIAPQHKDEAMKSTLDTLKVLHASDPSTVPKTLLSEKVIHDVLTSSKHAEPHRIDPKHAILIRDAIKEKMDFIEYAEQKHMDALQQQVAELQAKNNVQAHAIENYHLHQGYPTSYVHGSTQSRRTSSDTLSELFDNPTSRNLNYKEDTAAKKTMEDLPSDVQKALTQQVQESFNQEATDEKNKDIINDTTNATGADLASTHAEDNYYSMKDAFVLWSTLFHMKQ